jgi:hypothetical protein
MIRPILALTLLVATTATMQAQTPLQTCKSIADSIKRLRCYDEIKAEPAGTGAQPAQPATAQPAQPATVQPAQPATPGEDPLLAKAKATVKSELRDPDSAQFQDVKVRTVKGKQAVCGLVNAKNSKGGMTGLHPFAYDGEQVYLVVYNPGPGNSTSLSARTLGASMSSRVRNYNRLCK